MEPRQKGTGWGKLRRAFVPTEKSAIMLLAALQDGRRRAPRLRPPLRAPKRAPRAQGLCALSSKARKSGMETSARTVLQQQRSRNLSRGLGRAPQRAARPASLARRGVGHREGKGGRAPHRTDPMGDDRGLGGIGKGANLRRTRAGPIGTFAHPLRPYVFNARIFQGRARGNGDESETGAAMACDNALPRLCVF